MGCRGSGSPNPQLLSFAIQAGLASWTKDTGVHLSVAIVVLQVAGFRTRNAYRFAAGGGSLIDEARGMVVHVQSEVVEVLAGSAEWSTLPWGRYRRANILQNYDPEHYVERCTSENSPSDNRSAKQHTCESVL
jgi:hypothetical protein